MPWRSSASMTEDQDKNLETGDDKPESLVELIKNLSVKNEMATYGYRKQNITLKKKKQHNEDLYNVEE